MEQLYARDIYGKTLVELGKDNLDIVVADADLCGSTRTILFKQAYPDRFFNFGIAEQNMMAAAAGLAACGKTVFVSTFAMFASARALDQVRNAICYNKFNVKIVATHAGVTVGEDGASHQALEDISFLRAIPNIQIIIPCDAQETKSAVITAANTPGPFYIRLGRSKVPTIENKKEFQLGKGYIIEEGKDIAIIGCGSTVYEALLARDMLAKNNISAAVVNIHTIKPIDEQLLVALAGKYKVILVCEEHQVSGGLYSVVCETLAKYKPVHIDCIGVQDRFGQSGSPKELMDFYGLSANFISEKAKELLQQ
jgi:transketolase